MSHLQLPRIHFQGDFFANVCTANNDDIAVAHPDRQFVDSTAVKVDTMGMTDAGFSQWLRETDPPFGIRGGWNLYGDGKCWFENAVVRSVHPLSSDLISDPDADSLIGSAVEMRDSVMVDLDPEGTLGTQIFSDEFDIRGEEVRIQARRFRYYSRFVSRRNLTASGFQGFAATWSAAISPDDFSVQGNSPVIDSFREAADAGLGLFVSFCTYLLAPRIPQDRLAAEFASGRTTENPAVGRVIGTVGAIMNGEMTSLAVGRRLNPGIDLQHDHQRFRLNPAIAHVDRSRGVVVLDMVNTFPEVDESLAKVNIGPVSLAVVTEDEEGNEVRHTIGGVSYDKDHYELTSGIVDVPYEDELEPAIDTGRLVLINESGGDVLREKKVVVETDDRAVYLDYGESSLVQLRALESGGLPSGETVVELVQLITSNRSFVPATPETAVVTIPERITIPASGGFSLAVRAARPGTCLIVFVLEGEDASSLEFFTNIRVLPEDDYSHLSAEEITFPVVYREVLQYYHLLYPAMNVRAFDLSNELLVSISAQRIKDLIAPEEWLSSKYMPVTRELSAGKRRLLEAYCDLQLGIEGPGQGSAISAADWNNLPPEARRMIQKIVSRTQQTQSDRGGEEGG